MPAWLTFVLLSLASFRGTRLIVRDDFPPIAWARKKIVQSRQPVPTYDLYGERTPGLGHRWWWAGELVTCHWCASAYVSALAVALTDIVGSLPLPVLWAFAVWGAAAVLCDRLG
jgi:hypothetical protein